MNDKLGQEIRDELRKLNRNYDGVTEHLESIDERLSNVEDDVSQLKDDVSEIKSVYNLPDNPARQKKRR